MKTNHQRTQPEHHPSKKSRQKVPHKKIFQTLHFVECPKLICWSCITKLRPKISCAKQTAPLKGAVVSVESTCFKKKLFFFPSLPRKKKLHVQISGLQHWKSTKFHSWRLRCNVPGTGLISPIRTFPTYWCKQTSTPSPAQALTSPESGTRNQGSQAAEVCLLKYPRKYLP